MFALRRKAVQSADRVSAVANRGARRYASGGDHHAGAHADHGHHHAGPKDEAFGPSLYIVIAAIPVSMAVYAASRTSADGTPAGLSKIIDTYSSYQERWTARNSLHTSMVEKAATDRNLFQSEPGTQHINLRFPEVFNTGSPYNQVAGQRARSMDGLVAHYEKLNADAEEKKFQALAEKSS